MKTIDISVVLNIHREALWLRPTLLSLEACAGQAFDAGLTVELVAVFDRSDIATKQVFTETSLPAFVHTKVIEVDVGSLGLARNAGIAEAGGEYIWTADADDLVSANALLTCHRIAISHPYEKVAIFMEFLTAFGDSFHVARYFPSNHLTAADFAFQHPYISRIFIRRAVFSEFSYLDLHLSKGFAYEDWHLNCCLLEKGFSFKIAPDTILFYRQRSGSLLKEANRTSARLIPHTPLFTPQSFRKHMLNMRQQHPDWESFIRTRQAIISRNFTQELFSCNLLREYVLDAAHLEPEIAPHLIELSHSSCAIPWNPNHWGFHLERWFELLGNGLFSDVVFLPWLKPGGGEKYILSILHQLKILDSARKILVISGEPAQRHEWIDRLPQGSVFLDLFNAFPVLEEEDRMAMLIRSLLAIASPQSAYLHVKTCMFAHHMMDRYGAVLAEHFHIIYYRFSDPIIQWGQQMLQHPVIINFLRSHIDKITMLLCDCKTIANRDEQTVASSGEKYKTIYTKCALSLKKNKNFKSPSKRLLWASRVAKEKRPELLSHLIISLRANYPDLTIEIFGAITAEMSQYSLFNVSGLHYCGEFDDFSTLPLERFDAFIYTSAYDGLPNVILEAMSAGLPVIAPDIGGIGEVVIDRETGFLLPNISDDATLVSAYTDAVCSLYNDWKHTQAIAQKGQDMINHQHSEQAFAQRVQEVFLLNNQRSNA